MTRTRRVWRHRGELFLGEALRLFGLLGGADVDHQAAQQQRPVAAYQGDYVADPDHPAIGGQHPIVQAVVAAGLGFRQAVALRPFGILRVQGALPEARLQPVGLGVAEQLLGMRGDVGEAVVGQAHLPGDGVEALDQAAVMLLAVAQLFFQGFATEHFLAQAAIAAQHHGQHDQRQQQGGAAIQQDLPPQLAAIQHAADPGFLQGGDFRRAEVGEQLVEDADQHGLVLRCAMASW